MRPTANADETSDWAIGALLLYAQVGQCVLTCSKLVHKRYQRGRVDSPNTLLAYKFADKNWQSPFIDASGVKQLILVHAMSCFKKSRSVLALELMLTLFSHSNSVHMVRNCVSVHCAGLM